MDLGQRDEAIFDIVYHLNLGSSELRDAAERRELAETNLQAAVKSKAATAYEASLYFLKMGLELLGKNEAGKDPLAYSIMVEMPECEYMCGHIERAEQLLDNLIACTSGLIGRSHIHLIRIRMNAYLKRDAVAVNCGLQALAEFGWKIPLKPTHTMMLQEFLRTQWALYRSRNKIMQLPLNASPANKALDALVMAVTASAFIVNPELSAVLYPKFIRHGLKHGKSEGFVFVLAAYGVALTFVPLLQDMPTPYLNKDRLLGSALLLADSFESKTLKGRLSILRGLSEIYVNPEAAHAYFDQTVSYGLITTDLNIATQAMMMRITTHIGDLHVLIARMTDYEEAWGSLLDEVTRGYFHIARWYVDELRGDSGESGKIIVPPNRDSFDKAMNNKSFYKYTCLIEIAYLAGKYRETLKYVKQGRFNAYQQTTLIIRKQHIYESFALAALYTEASEGERKDIRRLLGQQLRSMKKWSGCFGRESAAYHIVRAEIWRIDGKQMAAVKGFEEAIVLARKAGYRFVEANACERASLAYKEAGMEMTANSLIVDAYRAYIQWGAIAKAGQIKQAYASLPFFLEDKVESSGSAADYGQASSDERIAELDGQKESMPELALFSGIDERVLKQTAGWTDSTDEISLLQRFLKSAMRYVGAERASIISVLQEGFTIESEIGGDKRTESDLPFAESIVRYVVQTGNPVVLADASLNSYSIDPYLVAYQPLSVLCMPIYYPGRKLPAVLYLENNLAPGVFTNERLGVLDILFSRMIHLESLESRRGPMNNAGEGDDSAAAEGAPLQQTLLDPPTPREMDVLQALTEGLSNKEIAIRFGLKEGTVKGYIFLLYGKLGVKRRSQAIARARELKLVD
jgi:DNA-binding CsgD family transcriptional regulator